MSTNKIIHREAQSANTIFNQRSLDKDYRTLKPVVQEGMRVLDMGCGTGAITKDIADLVGPDGYVVGIDNTLQFIAEGQKAFADRTNLELLHADLFKYESEEKFDLIVSARTFQWLSTIDAALDKIKTLLKPGGQLSILDYNHEAISWEPAIPKRMQQFYNSFLKWRTDAGMHNRIGEEIGALLRQKGFVQIEVIPADEKYESAIAGHKDKIGIWSKVASSSQTTDEGYISNEDRLQAIEDYTYWVNNTAQTMTMRLWETRAVLRKI